MPSNDRVTKLKRVPFPLLRMLPVAPLQGEEVTRKTFWLISTHEKALFYFLATVARK